MLIQQSGIDDTVSKNFVPSQEAECTKLQMRKSQILASSSRDHTLYWIVTPTKELLLVLIIADKSSCPLPRPYPPKDSLVTLLAGWKKGVDHSRKRRERLISKF